MCHILGWQLVQKVGTGPRAEEVSSEDIKRIGTAATIIFTIEFIVCKMPYLILLAGSNSYAFCIVASAFAFGVSGIIGSAMMMQNPTSESVAWTGGGPAVGCCALNTRVAPRESPRGRRGAYAAAAVP